jgi:hypothetical protein
MAGRPLAEKIAEITRWHKKRGFRAIGYHRVIDRDGSIGKGRDYSEQGAHAKGHNQGTIAVCLIGGKDSNRNDPFDKNYTAAQRKALLNWLDDVQDEFMDLPIIGHNLVSSKACPGFHVPTFLDEKPSLGFWALILKLFGVTK